jgi:hypothetical protein
MNRSMLRQCAIVGLAALAIAGPAHAKKPFVVGLQVGNNNPEADKGFSSVDGSLDYVDPDALAARYPTASVDRIDAALDFRGIDIGLDFGTGSGFLDFTVAQLGFSRQFGRPCVAAVPGDCRLARKQALAEVRDFLESNPVFLKRLLTALARFSPIDPLAGNPDSLFSRSSRADFQQGFTHKVSQIWGCNTTASNDTFGHGVMVAAAGDVPDIFVDARTRTAQLAGENELSIGLLTSSTTAESSGGDYATTGYVVPLSYTVKLDSDPRKKIRFDLPMGYTDTEGAVSYSLGFGVAYTHPLSDVWTLTPALGVGATGSEDLGSAGGVSSYSLTSAYTWRVGGFALSMGNSIGQYDALALKIGDVEAEADISNTVLTNGVLLTGPNSLIAKSLVMEYSLTDTRITGDEVYLDSYDEVGIGLGYIRTHMGVIDSYSRVGLSYLVGSGDDGDISSLRLNLGMRF